MLVENAGELAGGQFGECGVAGRALTLPLEYLRNNITNTTGIHTYTNRDRKNLMFLLYCVESLFEIENLA